MEYKRQIVTSWPITFFWVFLSLGLSILTIFSFLQADWIIKRNLITTNYYQLENETSPSGTDFNFTNSTIISSNLVSSSTRTNSPLLNSTSFESGGQDESTTRTGTDIETELLANDEYFLYNEENYTIFTSSLSSSLSQANPPVQKLIKVTKALIIIRFGTLGICTSSPRFNRSEVVSFQCQLYGNEQQFHSVSSLWPMVTIIGGGGCVTLCVSAVLSTLAVALPSSQLRYEVATTIGHAQAVAVGLLFLSLLIFPLGFDSDFVHYHCGSSAGIYNLGDCEIGWAYALVLVSASLALYCPILVKFTSDVRFHILPKYI